MARLGLLGLLGTAAAAGLVPRQQAKFVQGEKWQIILGNAIDVSGGIQPADAEAFDIDMFDNSPETIKTLKDAGKKVICYFSAGSYEKNRPDSSQFTAKDKIGKMDGWDEEWVDVRSDNIRKITEARINIAAQKGCDAIDPDNMDVYNNVKSSGITQQDSLDFAKFMADLAHKKNMAFGLKNAMELFEIGADKFTDFAVNEDCMQYDECGTYDVLLKQNKPVYHIEYPDSTGVSKDKACSDDRLSTVIKKMNLDGTVEYCDGKKGDTKKGDSSSEGNDAQDDGNDQDDDENNGTENSGSASTNTASSGSSRTTSGADATDTSGSSDDVTGGKGKGKGKGKHKFGQQNAVADYPGGDNGENDDGGEDDEECDGEDDGENDGDEEDTRNKGNSNRGSSNNTPGNFRNNSQRRPGGNGSGDGDEDCPLKKKQGGDSGNGGDSNDSNDSNDDTENDDTENTDTATDTDATSTTLSTSGPAIVNAAAMDNTASVTSHSSTRSYDFYADTPTSTPSSTADGDENDGGDDEEDDVDSVTGQDSRVPKKNTGFRNNQQRGGSDGGRGGRRGKGGKSGKGGKDCDKDKKRGGRGGNRGSSNQNDDDDEENDQTEETEVDDENNGDNQEDDGGNEDDGDSEEKLRLARRDSAAYTTFARVVRH